jgi:hypothetical protein
MKIAMLDTGIRQDDYEYLKEFPSPLVYKDFVSATPADTTYDNSGHGSTGISLLVKMCPNASLYIARVLDRDVATIADVNKIVQVKLPLLLFFLLFLLLLPYLFNYLHLCAHTEANICLPKAIDWAILEKVDIITMAIGFEKTQQPLAEAILRAHGKGILIFSAASNGRNVDPVYCPAIFTDQVFGIFSTDAGIRESRSLNPSPLDPENSFAIFGEDVEPPYGDGGPMVRGTSYSTSIAAGLAAALLDFSRQEMEKPGAPDLSRLKRRQQMKRVFREMANRGNGYYCIRPWKLLSPDLTYEVCGTRAEMRKRQRKWIRGSIERLLPEEKLHEL